MKKIIIVSSLLLLAFIPQPSITGFSYNPMADGYSLPLNNWLMTATYSPYNGWITPTTMTFANADNKLTYGRNECASLGTQPIFMYQYHNKNLPAGSGVNLGNIFSIAPNGTRYIGEVGGTGSDYLVLPPEPIYIENPTPNQALDVYSKVYAGCEDFTVIHNSFHTKIIYAGAGMWNGYNSRAFSLREYASELGAGYKDQVYLYIYCEGVGLCELRRGELNGNIVTGNLYYFLP